MMQIWEINGDVSLYLTQERCKQLSAEKLARVKINQKAKLLDKIITMIDKLSKEKDICKIEEEVKKYEALLEKENIQKQKDQQKLQEKLEKDKIELGKVALREQEKILRE